MAMYFQFQQKIEPLMIKLCNNDWLTPWWTSIGNTGRSQLLPRL